MELFISGFIILIILNIQNGFAQPGTPDSSFSKDGKVFTHVGNKAAGNSVALQADGKIVVAGSSDGNFALARYKKNGLPDLSFGVGGKVITSFGNTSSANAAAIQTDGKIVVCGNVFNGSYYDFGVARYKQNGTLDSSFGVNGKTTVDFEGNNDYANAMVIQPDEKIIVAGDAFETNGELSKVALVRYKADGTIDNSFGTHGKVAVHVHPYGFDDGNAVAIQSDGKIMISGTSFTDSGLDFALIRFGKNGNVDSSFGINGRVFTDFFGLDYGMAMALLPDGKIIVAGHTNGASTENFALAKYNKNGSPDSSFGTAGKATTDFGFYDYGYSVAIQSDRKIVVAGYSDNGTNSDFAIARYKANGSPDNSFGSSGKILQDFKRTDDKASSVVIQTDGKIVVAGTSNDRFVVARYNGDAALNNSNSDISFLQKNEQATGSLNCKIYPNPVQSILNIELNTANSLKMIISVYDVNGKSLFTKSANGNTQIDVRQLTAGTYLIKINDESGKLLYNGKVIKQ